MANFGLTSSTEDGITPSSSSVCDFTSACFCLIFFVLLSIKLMVNPAFKYASSSILDASLSNSKSTVVLNMVLSGLKSTVVPRVDEGLAFWMANSVCGMPLAKRIEWRLPSLTTDTVSFYTHTHSYKAVEVTNFRVKYELQNGSCQ